MSNHSNISIDVAKEESEVQAFLEKGKPYRKSFSIQYNREKLDKFIGFITEIKSITGSIVKR